MITKTQLVRLAPGANMAYVEALNGAMARFGIEHVEDQAGFLAQLLHESRNLTVFSENLNYAATALVKTWPTRFNAVTAEQYGRTAAHPADQVMIANIAYASRLGNGDVKSGDGWRYRGRGPIQLTFKNNYALCGAEIGVDLVKNPENLLDPAVGTLSSGWFWAKGNRTGRSLNHLRGDIDAISKVVNGGVNGLDERRALFEEVRGVLA